MGQLFDAFGIDLSLLIAQAINFGVLLVVLTYFLYRPVLRTLEERREKVAKGVADAEIAEAMLASADGEVATRIQGAEAEADTIVTSARDAASGEKARILKEAESRAAAIESDAQARAREEAARLMRESEKEITRLAILAAEKAMRKET